MILFKTKTLNNIFLISSLAFAPSVTSPNFVTKKSRMVLLIDTEW